MIHHATNCDHQNAPEARYCGRCGKLLWADDPDDRFPLTAAIVLLLFGVASVIWGLFVWARRA